MGAFTDCYGLTTATLGEGLEEIGASAFRCCARLQSIVIPDAVKTIKKWAFYNCRALTTVTLGNGLEEIEMEAFKECTTLRSMVIPPAVTRIHNTAYIRCSNLTSVKFSDEIERLVSCEAMRDWWKQGLHEQCLDTHRYLVRRNIPERLTGLPKIRSWQATIHAMLRITRTVHARQMKEHFDTIDAKLTVFEKLWNEAPTWFPEQFVFDDGIVQNILSYL